MMDKYEVIISTIVNETLVAKEQVHQASPVIKIFPEDYMTLAIYTIQIRAFAKGGLFGDSGPHKLKLSCDKVIITPIFISDMENPEEKPLNLLVGDSN